MMEKGTSFASLGVVEVCGICDIAGCHHIRERAAKPPAEMPVAQEPWGWWLRDLMADSTGFLVRKPERLQIAQPPEEWEVTPLYSHPATPTPVERATTICIPCAGIAGDMAGIIPESMMIEFITAANVGAAHALYRERCDWLDQQVSKAVLGQTATTDAVTGGLGSGEEHGDVRRDIETSDARALAAILNRDLVRPWVWLNHGEQKVYPRVIIARPEREDLTAFATAVGPLIDRGLPVSQQAVLAKFGLPEPKKGELLLRPQGAPAPEDVPPGADREIKSKPGVFKRGEADPGAETALQSEAASTARKSGGSPEGALADRMAEDARPGMAAILDQIEVMVDAAGSLEELREMLLSAFPQIDSAPLAQILGLGLVAAHAGGRAAIEEEAG